MAEKHLAQENGSPNAYAVRKVIRQIDTKMLHTLRGGREGKRPRGTAAFCGIRVIQFVRWNTMGYRDKAVSSSSSSSSELPVRVRVSASRVMVW